MTGSKVRPLILLIAASDAVIDRAMVRRVSKPSRRMRRQSHITTEHSKMVRLSLLTDALMNRNIGLKAVKAAARIGSQEFGGAICLAINQVNTTVPAPSRRLNQRIRWTASTV